MQMGSPAISLVTVNPSSDGVFRGNDNTSAANEVYLGDMVEGGVSSNYSHIGIWNPSGSGVTLLLDHLTIMTIVNIRIHVLYLSTMLASDDGVWRDLNNTGAAGVCHKCSEQNVSRQGTSMSEFRAVAFTVFQLDFKFPVVLVPDSGIGASTGSVNVEIKGIFTGREI